MFRGTSRLAAGAILVLTAVGCGGSTGVSTDSNVRVDVAESSATSIGESASNTTTEGPGVSMSEPPVPADRCTDEFLASLGASASTTLNEDSGFPLSFVGYICSGGWALVAWQNEGTPDAQGRWLIDLETSEVFEMGGPSYTPIGVYRCLGVEAGDAEVLLEGLFSAAAFTCDAAAGEIAASIDPTYEAVEPAPASIPEFVIHPLVQAAVDDDARSTRILTPSKRDAFYAYCSNASSIAVGQVEALGLLSPVGTVSQLGVFEGLPTDPDSGDLGYPYVDCALVISTGNTIPYEYISLHVIVIKNPNAAWTEADCQALQETPPSANGERFCSLDEAFDSIRSNFSPPSVIWSGDPSILIVTSINSSQLEKFANQPASYDLVGGIIDAWGGSSIPPNFVFD